MRNLVIVLAGAASFLASGCMGPDIAIVDLASGRVKHPTYASARQIVLGVDPSAQVFRTLVRDGDHLVLRTLDRNGTQIAASTLPLYAEGYCSGQGRALSPAGDRVAYLKEQTHGLCIYDLATQRETEIWPEVATFAMELPLIEWLSPARLLVVRERDTHDLDNQIVALDLATGERRTLATPAGLHTGDYALTPDRRLLAYWEARDRHNIYGALRLLDLDNGSIVASVGSGNDELLGHPSWSSDGRNLGYVEGRRICVFSRDTGKSSTVYVLEDDTLTYRLVMSQELLVHFGATRSSRGDWDKLPLNVVDWRAGRCIRKLEVAVNGGMFVLEKDKSILCEIGY